MTDTLDLEELKRLAASSPYYWTVGDKKMVNNSLPALIAEVERLRAELKPYRDEHDRARRLVGDPIRGVSFPVKT